MAHALVAAGCRPGDRVAAQVDKHWHVLALYLACLRAGLVYLPLNTGYQKRRARLLLRRREAARDRLQHRPPRRRSRRSRAERDGADARRAGRSRGRAAGASSPTVASRARRPRGDPLHVGHDRPLEGRDDHPSQPRVATRSRWSRRGASRAATCCCTRCPIYHVHGLFVATHCALLSGARMLWLPKFDAREVRVAAAARDGDDGRADVLHAPARRAVVHARAPAASIRLFVSGSAPLLAETFDAFRERTGHAILERYGMTETGMITSQPARRRARRRHRRQAAARRRRAHRRRAGRALRRRARSAACRCAGRTSSRGYWQMPEKTREEFTADGYFRTGDMGEWVATARRAATCGSSAAPRTSSSPAASTSTRRRSRSASTEMEGVRGVRGGRRARPRLRRGGRRGRSSRKPGHALTEARVIARAARRDRALQGAEARACSRPTLPAQRDGQGAEGGAAREARRRA